MVVAREDYFRSLFPFTGRREGHDDLLGFPGLHVELARVDFEVPSAKRVLIFGVIVVVPVVVTIREEAETTITTFIRELEHLHAAVTDPTTLAIEHSWETQGGRRAAGEQWHLKRRS